MVHFLRTENNRTIIECSVSKYDLSAATDLREYSNFLLGSGNVDEVVEDFSNLNEIRGWWWEREEMMSDWDSIDEFVKTKFIEVAEKYNLNYVTG